MRSIRSLLAASMLLMPSLASAQNVLFYSDNTTDRAQFATNAAANGWTTTFWGNGDGAKSAAQLSGFNSIVTGWSGAVTNYSSLLASKVGLTAARGSRTFLTGQDADYHETYSTPGVKASAALFLKNAVNWSASGTGLGVVVLSGSGWLTNVNSFLYSEMVSSVNYSQGGNNVIIPGPSAGYPVNAGLTSASLSNWASSYHMTFSTATAGYSTINLSGDYTDRAVTILTEKEAAGGTTATPEPASMVLLGTGLLGIFGVARRKRSA